MDVVVLLGMGIIIGGLGTYFIFKNKIARINREMRRLKSENQELKIENQDLRDNRIAIQPKPEIEIQDSGEEIEVKIEERTQYSTEEIQEFLRSKGIQIKSIREEKESDEVLDKIAMFMGERYSDIKNFYGKIKSNMNEGRAFTMNLRNDTQEKISNICQLGTRLNDIAYLEDYKYYKSPRCILTVRPNRIPQALNFFSGQWLERFVKEEVVQLIKSRNNRIRYSYLINPQIVLPNGNDFELDVIFKIEDEIFWFEAKTGDYQRHVEKYSRMSSMMYLDREHSYMILTDVQESSTKALTSLFKMKVVNVEKFAEEIKQSLQRISDNI